MENFDFLHPDYEGVPAGNRQLALFDSQGGA